MRMKISKTFAHVCILAILTMSGGSLLFAQSDVGTITGFVKDPSGAVVPNAKVVIKSDATGEEHAVTTDASGHYTVPNLLPATYTLSATAPGFKEYVSQAEPAASELHDRVGRQFGCGSDK